MQLKTVGPAVIHIQCELGLLRDTSPSGLQRATCGLGRRAPLPRLPGRAGRVAAPWAARKGDFCDAENFAAKAPPRDAAQVRRFVGPGFRKHGAQEYGLDLQRRSPDPRVG